MSQLQSNQTLSLQQWPGLQPSKFHHTQKIHLRQPDQLVNLEGNQALSDLGKKHYPPKRGTQQDWVPQLKTNIPRPPEGNTVEFPNGNYSFVSYFLTIGKKFIDFNPTKKGPRKEMRHVSEGKSGHIEDLPYGIKTFKQPVNECKRHEIEKMMGQKNRIEYLEQTRNKLGYFIIELDSLPLASLGDKPYKHPDYSLDYFKEGGLIPGANISTRKVLKLLQQTMIGEFKPNLGERNGEETLESSGKVKKRNKVVGQIEIRCKERRLRCSRCKNDFEQEYCLKELENWVENTLKEANPNYQDPDLFFENMAKQEEKPKGKDSKKGKK